MNQKSPRRLAGAFCFVGKDRNAQDCDADVCALTGHSNEAGQDNGIQIAETLSLSADKKRALGNAARLPRRL